MVFVAERSPVARDGGAVAACDEDKAEGVEARQLEGVCRLTGGAQGAFGEQSPDDAAARLACGARTPAGGPVEQRNREARIVDADPCAAASRIDWERGETAAGAPQRRRNRTHPASLLIAIAHQTIPARVRHDGDSAHGRLILDGRAPSGRAQFRGVDGE